MLVGAVDLIDNVGQIDALMACGFDGVFSFEPFTESIAQLGDVRPSLKRSIDFVRAEVDARTRKSGT